jgi:uncharacterized membrane protein
MNPRAPAIIACLLMGVPTTVFAVTSWSEKPWGLASVVAVTVAIGAVGLGISYYMARKQRRHQDMHGAHHQTT